MKTIRSMVSQKIETNKALLCPRCAKKLNGATGVNGALPADGDISVCAYCALVIVFRGKGMDLHFERMNIEQLGKLKKEDLKIWQTLMKYREAIIDLMGNNS